MKTLIITENGLNKIIKESFDDKIQIVKKFLDGNYMLGSFDDKSGIPKTVYIQLYNGQPTSKTCWEQDVIDKLDQKYHKIIVDKNTRLNFFKRVVDDWTNLKRGTKGISKYGSLTNYNF